MEREAAALPPQRPALQAPAGEAMAMLVRRGFTPVQARADLPFPPDFEPSLAEEVAKRIGHYAFRLFLRAAILSEGAFEPASMTRYLTQAQALGMAESLVELGLAKRLSEGRFVLTHPARSFGGTLEWYVARELRRRLGFEVAVGLKLKGRGIGGDLDLIAAGEGKLVYLELKSSPPKYLTPSDVRAFFDRVYALRPDVSIFAMDTSLRISDKVVPMLDQEPLGRRPPNAAKPVRIERELWALTPHIYAVNAKPDLISNICRAVAEGLRALAPPAP